MTPDSNFPRSLPGTQPEGARDEQQAAAHVRDMFSRIAPRYDLLNHLLSFSFDRLWRRRAARRFRHILARPGACVIDLCCGTGDLTLALEKRARKEAASQGIPHAAVVWGSDFAHPMLALAQKKSAAGPSAALAGGRDSVSVRSGVRFIEADALRLPFPDVSFDLVTSAFGFRNLANYEAGLREIYRILRPGGVIGILEFAAPPDSPFGAVYRLYFTRVLPLVGGAISGSPSAYSYLPDSVAKFPTPEELAAQMARSGFSGARFELWTGGIVALHTAARPAAGNPAPRASCG